MINVVVGILFPFIFFKAFLSQYAIIQSEHYEFYKYLLYEKNKKLLVFFISIALLLIRMFTDVEYVVILLFSIIITNVFLINKYQLKATKRVLRTIVIYFVFSYLLYFVFYDSNVIFYISALFYLFLSVIHYISLFLEKIIRYKYKQEAKKIVESKKVIGITGSYGKTSSKNILYDMLSEICSISKTPKSFNTEIGIIKSIREDVGGIDDYFICEYGVDKVGGMDKLLAIVKPNVSLITEVGPQHLLTFKTIENIRKEKIKLAMCLKEDEIAVINNDNEYLKASIKEFSCKCITYGLVNDSYIMAKNICITKEGSIFDLYIDNKKTGNVKISLLGVHNISNLLGAIGVMIALDVNENVILKLIDKIKPIEHRLQLKKINNISVIDDSFNSNEKGFKSAVEILNIMKGKRIIITPGIVEQGENSYALNYEMGKYMSDKLDVAILVEKNASVLKQGLLDGGFKIENIIMVKKFIEAWNFVKKIEGEKIVLIENDLPDIYLK